jgi:hypothetical protein
MKLGMGELTEFTFLMTDVRCMFFGHAFEPLNCNKGKEFPESLNGYQLLKKKPVPWSFIKYYDTGRLYLLSPQLMHENHTNLEAS